MQVQEVVKMMEIELGSGWLFQKLCKVIFQLGFPMRSRIMLYGNTKCPKYLENYRVNNTSKFISIFSPIANRLCLHA